MFYSIGSPLAYGAIVYLGFMTFSPKLVYLQAEIQIGEKQVLLEKWALLNEDIKVGLREQSKVNILFSFIHR